MPPGGRRGYTEKSAESWDYFIRKIMQKMDKHETLDPTHICTYALSDVLYLHVFGSLTGDAGEENMFDFPPPKDELMAFGHLYFCMTKTLLPITQKDVNDYMGAMETESCVSLSESRMEEIYELLFGGFEDLGDTDSERSVEDDVPTAEDLAFINDGPMDYMTSVEDDEDEEWTSDMEYDETDSSYEDEDDDGEQEENDDNEEDESE